MNIILASNSPRRREILKQLGLKFDVIPSSFEEEAIDLEPHALAEHFAAMKAKDVYESNKHIMGECSYVLGSDTIVFSDRIMGKPKDKYDAFHMLKELSGKEHKVISGISVVQAYTGKVITMHESTIVSVRQLSIREINSYIDSGEPMDKAGAYAIQGLGALFIEKIQGCYFNVVGLPVNKLFRIMKEFNIDLI